MTYGYSRVSTAKQAAHGGSLKEQEEALRRAGAKEIISEQYTGTSMERPALSALLGRMERGDKLIVTRLDRLARTAADGARTIEELHRRGVAVEILNMGTVDDTPMGRLLVHVLLAFAEFERDMIVERTQSGRERAREREGYRDGRPTKFHQRYIEHALGMIEAGQSYSEVARMTGISRTSLVRFMQRKRAEEMKK